MTAEALRAIANACHRRAGNLAEPTNAVEDTVRGVAVLLNLVFLDAADEVEANFLRHAGRASGDLEP